MIDLNKPNPMLDLLVALVIPSLILMKLSDPQDLGAVNALLLALAFPLFWGARELWQRRRFNWIVALGLVSILLTGGIGLLQLDNQWLAVKEAAVPGLIGLVVAGSALTSRPLVGVLLYTPALIDTERVSRQLQERGNQAAFDARLKTATWMLGASFFFSATMNYFLATWIVTSPAGSAAFNEELGRLTLLSYPMIALPSTLILLAVLYYISRAVRELAGLKLTEALRAQ
ncbi:VC0807 family protein [Hydrogenophaga sp.]|uniref:VC0807 family protein n=1 Tax=Hydrogenophaga sp. TaxID=1904254 RepID=UPI0019B18123|nr:VC0807 family protein [Hydrogenophaga sp.]MBD3894224.1 MFS transporter [Hydrogenophaga sp.]